jgi:hypothetical protein
MSKHGMLSSVARRVRNVGIQLKDQFIENYTVDGVIKSDLELHFNDNEINTFKLKVGSNWQFKLGRFPEIENIGFEIYSDGKVIKYKSNDQLKELFYNGLMFEKYAFNRRLFVCREGANWLFFRSVDINEYLKSNINVRILETGRIKIDLFDQTINKYFAKNDSGKSSALADNLL